MYWWLRDVRPAAFLGLAIFVIAISRLGVILVTPAADQNVDLSIYREVGELLANGVDPYDFSSQEPLREKLRLNENGAHPYVKQTRMGYNYLVSANLPGSTSFYGLLEIAFGDDDPRLWRVAFVLGDISIALAAYFFLQHVGVALQAPAQKIAFAAGVVAYPSLIEWGTFWPAEKQFQTALMLLLAGLLSATPKRPLWAAAAIAVTGSQSILFKALGVFLLSVALGYFRGRPLREFVVATLLFVLATIPFFFFFNQSFIQLLMDRAFSGSASAAAQHGSPWVLLPYSWIVYARPVVSAGLVAAILTSYLRNRIDLLNCMAAVELVFICVWTNSGSMDRMNVAMILGLMCIATMSVQRWQALTLFNFAIQAPIYTYIYVHHFRWNPLQDPERLDAWATAIFLVSYFCVLFFQPRLRASPLTAGFPNRTSSQGKFDETG